jgi:hypothetical protein
MPFTTNLEGKTMNNSIAKTLLSIGHCLAKARLVDFEMLKRPMHKVQVVVNSFGLLGVVMRFL